MKAEKQEAGRPESGASEGESQKNGYWSEGDAMKSEADTNPGELTVLQMDAFWLKVKREVQTTASLRMKVSMLEQHVDELSTARADAEEKQASAVAEAERLGDEVQILQQQILRAGKQLEEEQSKRTELQKEVERLNACIERRARSITGNHGARWQYQDAGCWNCFPPEGNDQMNQAYLAYLEDRCDYTRFATVHSAGVARKIDFQLMQQKRCDNNKMRKIRILPGVPAGWVTSAECLMQQSNHIGSMYIDIGYSNPELYERVCDLLHLTGHAQGGAQQCSCMRRARVISIHRVEHRRLWQGYQARRDSLRQELAMNGISVTPVSLDLDSVDIFDNVNGGVMTDCQGSFDCGEPLETDVDEKILLHGTSWDTANMIVLNGFDPRACHRGMYGDGVYFASAACKSHQYTCHNHKSSCSCKGERTLIIARVMLGDAYHAREVRKGEKRPPVRSDSCGVLYNSIVVNPGHINGHHNIHQVHQEFVIFDKEQAYPCYVVQYEL